MYSALSPFTPLCLQCTSDGWNPEGHALSSGSRVRLVPLSATCSLHLPCLRQGMVSLLASVHCTNCCRGSFRQCQEDSSNARLSLHRYKAFLITRHRGTGAGGTGTIQTLTQPKSFGGSKEFASFCIMLLVSLLWIPTAAQAQADTRKYMLFSGTRWKVWKTQESALRIPQSQKGAERQQHTPGESSPSLDTGV